MSTLSGEIILIILKKNYKKIILIMQPVTIYEHIYIYKKGPKTAQVLANKLSTLKKKIFNKKFTY